MLPVSSEVSYWTTDCAFELSGPTWSVPAYNNQAVRSIDYRKTCFELPVHTQLNCTFPGVSCGSNRIRSFSPTT